MKTKLSILLAPLFLLFYSSLFSQIISGGGNGQSTGKTVSPSEVTSGGFAGDVSLFSGTYNSSYTLGTVSTNSGISYTATLTHSSTYTSGDNLPHVSGVPYGDGWNLDVPTINVSTEDFNKYSLNEAYWRGLDPSQTEEYYDGDCDAAEQEGRLYWFAPNISIPGVASGRMVYKYRKGNWHVFVLHKFERYIEAHFTGTYWIVYLDDGTIYEFEASGIAHRTASNQRVQSECSAFGNGIIDENAGQSVANLVLPKTETLTWHCSQIKNRNLVGGIKFNYERYGAFDFNKVFQQERTAYDINDKWFGNNNRPWLHTVYREILLTEISSSYERLVLNYEVLPPTKAISNILDPTEDGVEIVDNMYAKKTVLEWGGNNGGEDFDDWFRYKHLKRDNNDVISPTNPYTGQQSGALEAMHHRESVSGTQVPFRHGFLESPRIQADPANMPLGDLYELENTIYTNWSASPRGDCLFDINVGTGDNTIQANGQGPLGNASGGVKSIDFNRTRGESIYSTFNKAVKWYNFGSTNAPGGNGADPEMVTSDLFVLPNLPDDYGGFHIQVGPANSDNKFDVEAPVNGSGEIDLCQTYYDGPGFSGSAQNDIQPGDDMRNNFGIGLPWAMMSDFYAYMNPDFGLGYCDASNGSGFWWNQNLQSQGNWENHPTKAGDNIQLRKVKLVRYGKLPYMLKSVVKQVLNTGDIELDSSAYCDANRIDAYYRNISQLKFEYNHKTAPIYNTYIEEENGVEVTKVKSTAYFRNLFLLSKIIQLPAEAGVDTPMGDHPTTQFAYKQDNSAEIHFPNVMIDDDFYGVPGLSQFINSNFSVIEKITDPLGKVTTIEFAEPGFSQGSSYYTSRYEYRRRPHELNSFANGGNWTIKQAPGYGFQVYMVVDKVNVEDRSGMKTWDYTFSGFTGRNDEIIPLSYNFIQDWNLMGIRKGFTNTTVSGPGQGGGSAPRVEYVHNTSDLLWGKVNQVKTYDASGNQLSQSESDYETVMAFEPATHRASTLRYQEWDYYDYYKAEYVDNDRPLFSGDFTAYNDSFNNWVRTRIDSDLFGDWLDEGALIDPPNLVCTNVAPEDCNCANYDNLNLNNQLECDRYWREYSEWIASRPTESVDYFSKSHPDISTQGGQFDTPYFYESRHDRFIEAEKPSYLYSFFIKKTADRQTTFDPDCSEGGIAKTTTTYEYYDANHRGIPQSPDAFSQILQGGSRLFYEPSWQLFRKRTSSDQLLDAYTEEEFYYTYDLLNNPTFHDNDHLLPDGILKNLYNKKKIRTLAYETRVKSQAPGEAPITRSTYFIYKNDWKQAQEGAVFVELTENPCGEGWPCTDDVHPNDDGGGSWDVIYTDNGEPCVLYPHNPDGYDCPHEDFPAYWCPCGAEEGEDGPGEIPDDEPRNVNDFLGGNIYLSQVHTQIEAGGNEILTFSGPTLEPIFPYKHLKTNEILSRNLWGQVVREKNQRGIVTYYDYGEVKVYSIPICIRGEQAHERVYSRNTSGQPVAVTVGAGVGPLEPGEPDALTTLYEYNLDHTIAKITDPNGMELTYEYDEYKRMNAAYRNGEQIQGVVYSNWNNIDTDFKSKAAQNSVYTVNYVGNLEGSWSTTAFVDPLGRNVANVRAGILVEDNIYDIYDQPVLKLKPASGGQPTVDFAGGSQADHAEFLFDVPGRSRVLKSSKYGEPLSGQHVVTNDYCLSSSNTLQTELNGAGQNQMPPGSVFFRTETTDEDGKIVISYSNAVGQSVATITNNGTYATVFIYDSFGNVKETYNPENQKTEYKYNYLGLLYEKVTLDAGTTTYGYDHSGNLISEDPASTRVILYEYDKYGRMVGQVKTQTAYDANEGLPWVSAMTTEEDEPDFAAYEAILGAMSSMYEKQWFYNEYDPTNIGNYSANALPYLQNSLTNTLGRLVQSISYDREGETIEYKWLSYNDDGFLKWEMMQLKQPQDQLVRIDYPDYNLQGSYRIQNVDINGDEILDFQYRYVYDNQNRVGAVYANYDNPDEGNGNQIVQYQYDNVKDVVDWKKYYDKADPLEGQSCSEEEEIDHIQYGYDDRFRLTSINSHLFDYALFYDADQPPVNGSGSNNYNGNINGITAGYDTAAAANGAAASIMEGLTSYQYMYDNLNRLTQADAFVDNNLGLPSQANWGDALYGYDKVGNFTSLQRWIYDGSSSNTTPTNYLYHYGNNNRLNSITDDSPDDRDFDYDLDGNIIWDSKKQMIAGYGRANLPWGVSATNPKGGTTVSSYLYDAADARIFKTVTLGTNTTQEYYIRSASGQELAVYNMSDDQITWYVYGNERVAKIHQKKPVNPETPLVPAPCDPNPPDCDENMLNQQLAVLPNIRAGMATRTINNIVIPSSLIRIRLCDGTELHLFEDELAALPGNYMVLQVIEITNLAQQFMTSGGGYTSSVDLAGLLLARVNDENVYIDFYEPCINAITCDDVKLYPAHSIGASTLMSTYYNDPPYGNMTLNHPNGEATLVEDDVFWSLYEPINGLPDEAEWDVSYTFSNPAGVSITAYKVIIDYFADCSESRHAKLGLYDGTSFIPVNGGQTLVSLDCHQYPGGALDVLVADGPLTVDQVANMRLAILRQEGTVYRMSIDVVKAEVEYSYLCPCDTPALPCPGTTITTQNTMLGDLQNSIQNTNLNDVAFPTELYRVRYCDGSEKNVLRQEMSIVNGGNVVLRRLVVNDVNQLFSVEQNGLTTEVPFHSLIDIRRNEPAILINEPCNPPVDDPFETPMEEDLNPEVPDIYFYVHDHLGNTRVLYHTEYDCESIEKSYIFDHVVDYYPYGKVLREFVNGEEEKFLTTHHERDQESGLDYRGARFYDADIGRFLSLDPLAMEFADMSPYNYVFANPLRLVDKNGRAPDWIDNGDGTYTAQAGDSASSLAKDAGINNNFANHVVESQLGANYIGSDGGLKSNVEVGDIVDLSSYQIGWSDGESSDPQNLATTSSPAYSTADNPYISTLLGSTTDGLGGFGAGMIQQGGSMRFTNGAYNGNIADFGYYKNGWGGGSVAQIKTYKLTPAGKIIGKVGTAGTVIVGGADIVTNAINEGGFGKETQKATGRTVGAVGGSIAGAEAGAAIGVWFGGWGAIPGGIIGGIFGGWGGSELGETGVEYAQDKLKE